MSQNEYDKLCQTISNKIQVEIDSLTEQEKGWSEEQKIKAREIQQLIDQII